jgi:hypothetical protein
MEMNCNFTLKHYEEICNIIAKSQYKICFFNNCSSDYKNTLILRHDIDQSLEQSIKIAIIENKYNIKSTFFIWLRSPFYNIFEKKYSDIIYEIINLGHQIGLHFDESVYKIDNEIDLNQHVEKEINLIKTYFDINIFVVSMHRPSKWLLSNDIKLYKYINTYEKKFFKDFKYFSDSRRQWRESCICNKIDISKYNKLHILIHPFWWVNKDISFNERMSDFIRNKVDKLETDLENNISVYKKNRN